MADIMSERNYVAQKLERLRAAAREHEYQLWGDVEEMRRESVEVYNAYSESRDRANQLGY